MKDLKALTKKIIEFREEREWSKYHNLKDLAISLSLETSELLEHFQWKNGEELDKYISKNKDCLSKEVSDVLYCVLLISHELKIDLIQSFNKKMVENAKKYPIKEFKGSNKKYNKAKL